MVTGRPANPLNERQTCGYSSAWGRKRVVEGIGNVSDIARVCSEQMGVWVSSRPDLASGGSRRRREFEHLPDFKRSRRNPSYLSRVRV